MSWTVAAIGSAAALCSMASFGPQAYRIFRTRDTQAISAPMYVLTVIGFALWLGYGLLLGQWPLTIANGVCFALSSMILFMKLSNRFNG